MTFMLLVFVLSLFLFVYVCMTLRSITLRYFFIPRFLLPFSLRKIYPISLFWRDSSIKISSLVLVSRSHTDRIPFCKFLPPSCSLSRTSSLVELFKFSVFFRLHISYLLRSTPYHRLGELHRRFTMQYILERPVRSMKLKII